jgi:hypothetical protein
MDVKKIKEYIKNNKLNTAVLSLLILAISLEYFQYSSIKETYIKTQHNKEEIELVRDDLEQKHLDINEKLQNTDIVVNSRIDILNNAVNIDEKRKVLLSKVRTAISENTTTKMDIRTLNKMAMAVVDYSYEFNLSIADVLAQIRAESNFDPYAKSNVGAAGLGQIMGTTHEYLMIKLKNPTLNPWDVKDNVLMTCAYMSELWQKFGNFEDALRGYNGGADTVRKVKAGMLKGYMPETEAYVPQVLVWRDTFKRYGLE